MASSTNPSVKSNSGQVLEAEDTTNSISTVTHDNTAKNGNRRGTKKRSRNQKKKVLCNPLQGAKFWVPIRKTSKNTDSAAPPRSHHDVPVLETEEAVTTRACSTDSDAYDQLKQSSIFRDFSAIFEDLDLQRKNCLLSFAVFPENAVVKKRLLVYWWIGEGLLDPPPSSRTNTTGEKTVEKIATEVLQDFMAKRFIIPVNTKRKTVVNRFKMDPILRSLVILLARESKFFDYDSSGELTCKYSGSERACLINSEKLESENQDKIKTLFNVNRRFLDFTFDWFSKMKNVRVLGLGMWQSSVEYHHIEVENSEFLKGLKNMEFLRLLSLQEISGIEVLPNSISKLRNLRILDLRACYNLESLPKEIKSLKLLTHLDISECYLLDHMPKELASLSDLQVLKGFVITDVSHGSYCTLADLLGLKKLRKLSINVNSDRETFLLEELSTTLSEFEELEKLKIAWGGGSKVKERITDTVKKMVRQKTLLEKVVRKQKSKVDRAMEIKKLQKLDLQCFPQQTLPDWLIPENLKNLKKLYIRGGGLNSLSNKIQEGEIKWEVDVLHLKYLSELKINWSELKAMFPKLSYLEKFKCPKVTFCPCDGSGVWLKSSTN